MSPAENVAPLNRTHQQFLKALAGDLWKEVWVAAGNVSEVAADAHWGGLGYAEKVLSSLEPPRGEHLAQYFAVATIKKSARDKKLKKTRPSRRVENFVAGFCLVFDDVGTGKDQHDPQKIKDFMGSGPTTGLTSSGGNGQWNYRLQVPCLDPIKFKAAHVALGELGLTDKGGINPVRYMRLPGGINGKAKHGPDPTTHPKVRLTEFDPNVSVSPELFEQLVQIGLDSPNMVTGASGAGCADLNDPDPVLEQLMALGWAKGPDPSEAGLVLINCPFVAEHTGGDASGTKYLGGGRVFCHHGHCRDRNGWGVRHGEFKAEIDRAFDDAGLAPAHGSVAEWRASKWFGSADVIDGDVVEGSGDENMEALANSEDRHSKAAASSTAPGGMTTETLRGLGWENFKTKFVFATDQQVFVRRDSKRLYSPAAFNALGAHAAGGGSQGGKNSASARFLDPPDTDRGEAPGTVVDALTSVPGAGEIVTSGNRVEFNMWRPGGLVLPPAGSVLEADVRIWLDHVAKMFDGRADAVSVILDWFAWLVGKPGQKVNWCPVIVGKQGTGKDLMIWPVLEFLGQHNYATVGIDDLRSDYTSRFIRGQLIIFNELSTFEKRMVADKLKPLIASPPKTLTVTEKYEKPYDIPNTVLTFGMTNRLDGLMVENTDRRYWIYVSPAMPMSAADASALVAWYQAGGSAKLARYLLDRGVSAGFDPGVCPPDVGGHKAEVAREGMSDVMQFLLEQLVDEDGEFAGLPVIYARKLVELGQRASTPRGVAMKINGKSASMALREAGFEPMGVVQVDSKTLERPWRRGGISEAEALAFIRIGGI